MVCNLRQIKLEKICSMRLKTLKRTIIIQPTLKMNQAPESRFCLRNSIWVASLSCLTTFISYILRIHVKHTKIVRVSKSFPCLIILALNLARQMYINFTLKDVCSICLIQSYIFDVVFRCGFLGRIYLLDHCSISWCCFPFFEYNP